MSGGVKKQRVPNFTLAEKSCLLNLISAKYAKIIENKETNRISTTEKVSCWAKIEVDFNALCPSNNYRDSACLKRYYENEKKKVRKIKAVERQELFKTGGGTAIKVDKDAADELLLSIMNPKTVIGLSNPLDCDNVEPAHVIAVEDPFVKGYSAEISNKENEIVVSHEESLIEMEDELAYEISLADETVHTWAKYTPSKLTEPLHPALKVHTNNVRNRQNETPQSTPTTATSKRKEVLSSSRRRPMQTIKTLTSSEIAEKYNVLLDKRLAILEKQLAEMEQDKLFKQRKYNLEIKLLELKIKVKENKLQNRI